MAIEIIPDWMANLDDEDVIFIKKFILASGPGGCFFHQKISAGVRFPEGDRLPVPCDLSYSPAEAG